MKILIACEFSGTVRDAFIRRGHDAVSCDLLPSESDFGPHIVGDVLDLIKRQGGVFDLMIAHPPCTYLTVSGLHWNKRRPDRAAETEKALDFVRQLLNAPIPRIALENPVGCISTAIRKPTQIIQPYEFGADASKKTCLWLNGLMPLITSAADRIAGRMVEWPKGSGKLVERWANQTDSGQNNLSPGSDRWALRSITYPGIAEAMANQWG